MSDGLLAWIIVTGVVFAVWMCLIIAEKLDHPKPKAPPKVLYNPANNEPIGFDFNHKDWDAPQWEAPEWTFDRPYMRSFQPQPMLVSNQILNTNEIRAMNAIRIISEINHGEIAILPEGMSVQYLNNEAARTEYLSHIRAIQSECEHCMSEFTFRNYKDELVHHGYNQHERASLIKFAPIQQQVPIIKLPPPLTQNLKH